MSWKAQYEQHKKWHDMTFTNLKVDTKAGGKVSGHGSD